MNEASENSILEILREIQSDVSVIKHDIKELKSGLASLRQEVHTLKGDLLRQERAIAMLDMRVERIENRLDLRDA